MMCLRHAIYARYAAALRSLLMMLTRDDDTDIMPPFMRLRVAFCYAYTCRFMPCRRLLLRFYMPRC